ncbi:hypothetical protein M8C13_19240 [Crossiella sp. SN42]|uniref:hypothetical protein n=1 Tax=Crossiella sp. SN42 TaxID=2944808 RepID=UPI00207CFBB8|nr:hypothetical protein [Crossiella sp. SN42]MCO1577892.1 hypothetical protein [Crossiella sp. SN42]
MAIIVIPGHESRSVRNETLRQLSERAGKQLADPEDRFLLEQAAAMNCLDFELVALERRGRLAQAVIDSAVNYRDELLRQPALSDSDRSRAEALAELPPYLRTLLSVE